MERIMTIKKNIKGNGEECESYALFPEDKENAIVINIRRNKAESREAKLKKRLSDVVGALFELELEMEADYLEAVIEDPEMAVICRQHLTTVRDKIKQTGLWEGFKAYRIGGVNEND